MLAGTPFLFKSYEILQAEQEARAREPSFSDKFKMELDNVVALAKTVPQRVFGPVMAWLRGDDAVGAISGGAAPAAPAQAAPSSAAPAAETPAKAPPSETPAAAPPA